MGVHHDWVVRREDGSVLVGLDASLAAYGAEGWELVGLNPDGFRAYRGFEEWDLEPRLYRATFKRAAQG
jgi:hypothetical protein